MSYCVYRATSGVTGRAWGGLAGASGPVGVPSPTEASGPAGASEGLGLFDLRESL